MFFKKYLKKKISDTCPKITSLEWVTFIDTIRHSFFIEYVFRGPKPVLTINNFLQIIAYPNVGFLIPGNLLKYYYIITYVIEF